MCSFMLRANKLYLYNQLTESEIKTIEKIMNEYREYIQGGEKNKTSGAYRDDTRGP